MQIIMKNSILCIILAMSFTIAMGQVDQTRFSNLSGPYLGQTVPGNIPQVFAPGFISTDKNQCHLVFHPSGKEIFFSELVFVNDKVSIAIYSTQEINGLWTIPALVPFSGVYEDGYLGMHPDGSRLYFQSSRPINIEESTLSYNIWYLDRSEDGWSNPKSIGKPINGRKMTSGPSVTQDGNIYFTYFDNTGLNELYCAEKSNDGFKEPVRLPNSINSSRQQFDSYIAPDESYLIFGSYLRSDTYGGTDLYVSFRDNNGRWLNAVNLGPMVNTKDDEGSAQITPDGKYLFFSRLNNAPVRNLDMYWMSSKYIDSLRREILSGTEPKRLPISLRIGQNFPNPVQNSCTIPFSIDKNENLSLHLLDEKGIKILSVFENLWFPAGKHIVPISAESLPQGYIYYQLENNSGITDQKKMLVIK
jgi:hypothetical protein